MDSRALPSAPRRADLSGALPAPGPRGLQDGQPATAPRMSPALGMSLFTEAPDFPTCIFAAALRLNPHSIHIHLLSPVKFPKNIGWWHLFLTRGFGWHSVLRIKKLPDHILKTKIWGPTSETLAQGLQGGSEIGCVVKWQGPQPTPGNSDAGNSGAALGAQRRPALLQILGPATH